MNRLPFIFALLFSTITFAADDVQSRSTLLIRQLKSGNPRQVIRTLHAMEKWMDSNPAQAANLLQKQWISPLNDAQCYDAILTLSISGIIKMPADTATVYSLQTMRVQALLKLNRPNEALASAKSLFNIAPLDQTQRALLLVAQSLNATNPDDPELIAQLRSEQIASAQPSPTTRPSPLMKQLHVDITPIATVLAEYETQHYLIDENQRRDLMAAANLFLLADRPDDALDRLMKLRDLVPPDSRPDIDQHIARAIKAQDGSIGRANQYLLDHQ